MGKIGLVRLLAEDWGLFYARAPQSSFAFSGTRTLQRARARIDGM